MASITGPYVLDFTGAQEGFVPVYRDAQPNKIAWEEAPTGGGDEGGGATPAGANGAVQFNDGGAFGGIDLVTWHATGAASGTDPLLHIGSFDGDPVNVWFDACFGPLLIAEPVSGPVLGMASSGGNGAQISVVNSRGTYASPAASQSGDFLLGIVAYGANGADVPAINASASIHWFAEGTITNDAVPGRLVVKTQGSSGDLLEALRINSNQSVLALWGLGPITYFEDPTTPMQAPIAAVDQMLLYGAGAATPTFYFAYSDGSYASPTATPLNAVIGKIQFEGAGTDGTANSVNGQSAIIATNRSSDPDAIVADIDFFTAATELSVRYDGGIVLPHEFANGSDPAAPASGGRLYIVQTAGGKSQLAVRFPSGDPQIVATEP